MRKLNGNQWQNSWIFIQIINKIQFAIIQTQLIKKNENLLDKMLGDFLLSFILQ